MTPRPSIPAGRHPLRLLVVEEDPLVRGMLVELLEQAGYEVEETGAAETALELTRFIRWDGLVLDMDLPRANGVELYARLIRHGGGRPLPALLFADRPDPALQLGLASLPWARFVAKPCGGLRLVALMRQCVLAARDAEAASRP